MPEVFSEELLQGNYKLTVIRETTEGWDEGFLKQTFGGYNFLFQWITAAADGDQTEEAERHMISLQMYTIS